MGITSDGELIGGFFFHCIMSVITNYFCYIIGHCIIHEQRLSEWRLMTGQAKEYIRGTAHTAPVTIHTRMYRNMKVLFFRSRHYLLSLSIPVPLLMREPKGPSRTCEHTLVFSAVFGHNLWILHNQRPIFFPLLSHHACLCADIWNKGNKPCQCVGRQSCVHSSFWLIVMAAYPAWLVMHAPWLLRYGWYMVTNCLQRAWAEEEKHTFQSYKSSYIYRCGLVHKRVM